MQHQEEASVPTAEPKKVGGAIDPKALTDHPVAAKLPLMSESEFALFKANMAERGFDSHEPIVLVGTEIIDGRNRNRAALELGIEPAYIQFSELGFQGSFKLFVLQRNLHRRHLTRDQQVMALLEFKPDLAQQAKERQAAGRKKGKVVPVPMNSSERGQRGEVTDQLAAMGRAEGITRHMLRQADEVANKRPELAAEVTAGRLTLRAAHKRLREQIGTKKPPATGGGVEPYEVARGAKNVVDALNEAWKEEASSARPWKKDVKLRREVCRLVGEWLRSHADVNQAAA